MYTYSLLDHYWFVMAQILMTISETSILVSGLYSTISSQARHTYSLLDHYWFVTAQILIIITSLYDYSLLVCHGSDINY